MRLKNKAAIVTGATSGIGEASAKMLAAEGASVVIAGRNREKGLQIQEEIVSAGGEARFLSCDVRQKDQIQDLVQKTKEIYGGIDILFNNAGVFATGPLDRIALDEWEEMYRVNVRGIFLTCQLAMPYLEQSEHASVINNASIVGMQSYCTGRSYIYASSKAAVIQFGNVLAQNYGEKGVRVNSICPGIIDTRMLGDRNREEYAKRVPLGYLGKPEDVAKVVVFLASEEAGYVTGAVIPVDGGVSI